MKHLGLFIGQGFVLLINLGASVLLAAPSPGRTRTRRLCLRPRGQTVSFPFSPPQTHLHRQYGCTDILMTSGSQELGLRSSVAPWTSTFSSLFPSARVLSPNPSLTSPAPFIWRAPDPKWLQESWQRPVARCGIPSLPLPLPLCNPSSPLPPLTPALWARSPSLATRVSEV